jgi:hypothetical protein
VVVKKDDKISMRLPCTTWKTSSASITGRQSGLMGACAERNIGLFSNHPGLL